MLKPLLEPFWGSGNRLLGSLPWVSMCSLWCVALFVYATPVLAETAEPPVALYGDVGVVAPSTFDPQARTVLIGLGDSLTHGTMDATNNAINTSFAYLQHVAQAMSTEVPVAFAQPFFDERENRLSPFPVPSNLGVDGSDVFSLVGLRYYKRAGIPESLPDGALLADQPVLELLTDKYDKVLFPINVLAGGSVSQLESALWLINSAAPAVDVGQSVVIVWIGNNDSSLAALGAGGKNPEFQPIPLDQIESELDPVLAGLLRFGEAVGAVSFEPYSVAAIERNLTLWEEFFQQYLAVTEHLVNDGMEQGSAREVFMLTLPYYTAVGYLMDSEDLEYYLRKVDPSYSVPGTFKRVSPPGQPITEPFRGDRISLLTFGFMYTLLSTGHSVDEVNQVLEVDGQQQDGLVLSEQEQRLIMSRIDDFNRAIKVAATLAGPSTHVIDIGQFLNDALAGKIPIVIDGREFTRKWVRGSSFSFDGVHPSYVGHALIANVVLAHLNATLGIAAPLRDLSASLAIDPYVDRDGDGWAPGPGYVPVGLTRLLFLFKDPDDADPVAQVALPPDVWTVISEVLLGEILDIPAIRAEAVRLGLVATPD